MPGFSEETHQQPRLQERENGVKKEGERGKGTERDRGRWREMPCHREKARGCCKIKDRKGGERPEVMLPSFLKLSENEPHYSSPSGSLTRTFHNQQGPHQTGIIVAIIIIYCVLIFKYLNYGTNPLKCHILNKSFQNTISSYHSLSTNYRIP